MRSRPRATANGHRTICATIWRTSRSSIPTICRGSATLGALANAQPLWAAHEAQMDDLTIPFLGRAAVDMAVPVRLARAPRRDARDGLGLVGLHGRIRWRRCTSRSTARCRPTTRIRVENTRRVPARRADRPRDRRSAAFTMGSAYVNHREDDHRIDRGRQASRPRGRSTATSSTHLPMRSPPRSAGRHTSTGSACTRRPTPEPEVPEQPPRTAAVARQGRIVDGAETPRGSPRPSRTREASPTCDIRRTADARRDRSCAGRGACTIQQAGPPTARRPPAARSAGSHDAAGERRAVARWLAARCPPSSTSRATSVANEARPARASAPASSCAPTASWSPTATWSRAATKITVSPPRRRPQSTTLA